MLLWWSEVYCNVRLADRVRLYEKKKLKLKKVFNECSEYCASGHCARKYRGLVTEKKMLRRVLRWILMSRNVWISDAFTYSLISVEIALQSCCFCRQHHAPLWLLSLVCTNRYPIITTDLLGTYRLPGSLRSNCILAKSRASYISFTCYDVFITYTVS